MKRRLPSFRLELEEFESLPVLYGVAYRDFWRDRIVCYPVPFNWLVRFLRWAGDKVRFPRPGAMDGAGGPIWIAYKQGLEDGRLQERDRQHFERNPIQLRWLVRLHLEEAQNDQTIH